MLIFFRFKYFITAILYLLSLTAYANKTPVKQDEKPLPKWEIGAVMAGFHSPLFPASKDSQNKFLAVPYGVYRGENFSIGDGSIIKAHAVKAPRFKVDVSLNAAFNADSDESKIRENMPDLDFLFEVGPQFRFLLSESSIEFGAGQELWLNLQTRAVFSTNFKEINHRGYVFQPQLAWRGKNQFWNKTISFASISPILASEKMHDYFYQVAPQYQTDKRRLFDAKAGYLGTKISVGNIFQIKPEMSIFIAGQLGLWQGSKNEESPLYEQKNNFSAVIGLRYTFVTSKEKI